MPKRGALQLLQGKNKAFNEISDQMWMFFSVTALRHKEELITEKRSRKQTSAMQADTSSTKNPGKYSSASQENSVFSNYGGIWLRFQFISMQPVYM